jgi:molybdate transport system substrate-binding protein
MDELSLRTFMDRKTRVMLYLAVSLSLFFVSGISAAQELKLAVSKSILDPITDICQRFNQETKHKCKLTSASTGHLYGQIMHASPYDILLSSDESYTQALISALKADPDRRLIVAVGRVVLWSADPQINRKFIQEALANREDLSIAIANPGVTPYGVAAKEVLQHYQLWPHVQGRIIWGKNLQHTFDLISNNKVPLGFVALSQLSELVRQHEHFWEPASSSYRPVHHEAIALLPNRHAQATQAFMDFLQTKQSCEILQGSGYSCSAES